MKILRNYVKTSNILDITFESGESWSNPGRACDYMLARVDGTKIYAELPAADDEWEHYDALLAEIIGLTEDKNIPFNEVKVNSETIRFKATFYIPSVYADYFDDADVYADSLSELEERLNAMQNEADEKMANAWRHARALSPSEYYNAPTYAFLARVELVTHS